MYNSIPYQYLTKASTNLTNISGASETAKLCGYVIQNTSAVADVYVKLYWSRQGEVPVVGTTVPDITFGVAVNATPVTTVSQVAQNFSNPIGRMGQLWMWVTPLAAATDTNGTGAGDGIITLLLQY
jgi:hypothetical protein